MADSTIIVPTYEQPTVRSTAGDSGYLNVSSTPDSFGAESAAEGSAFDKAFSDDAAQYQDYQDKATVFNANTASQTDQRGAFNDPDTGIYAQKGVNALNGVQQAQDALTSIHNQYLDTLDTPRQKQMFSQMFAEQANAHLDATAAHVREQTQIYNTDSYKANQDVTAGSAATNFTNDNLVTAAKTQSDQAAANYGQTQGWSDAQIQQEQLERRRAIDVSTIGARIAADPNALLTGGPTNATQAAAVNAPPNANGTQPLGIANNNPGNLKGTDAWIGKTGTDQNGYVQFATPQAGLRAQGVDLINQQDLHGLNTVQDIVTKYAPPGDNNDTASYVADISKKLGVAPTDKLNLKDQGTLSTMMGAMIQHENGQQPYDQSMIDGAATAAISGNGPQQANIDDAMPNAPDYDTTLADGGPGNDTLTGAAATGKRPQRADIHNALTSQPGFNELTWEQQKSLVAFAHSEYDNKSQAAVGQTGQNISDQIYNATPADFKGQLAQAYQIPDVKIRTDVLDRLQKRQGLANEADNAASAQAVDSVYQAINSSVPPSSINDISPDVLNKIKPEQRAQLVDAIAKGTQPTTNWGVFTMLSSAAARGDTAAFNSIPPAEARTMLANPEYDKYLSMSNDLAKNQVKNAPDVESKTNMLNYTASTLGINVTKAQDKTDTSPYDPTSNRDKYNDLAASIDQRVSDFASQNGGRQPNADQYRDMLKSYSLNIFRPGTLYGQNSDPAFNATVPDDKGNPIAANLLPSLSQAVLQQNGGDATKVTNSAITALYTKLKAAGKI